MTILAAFILIAATYTFCEALHEARRKKRAKERTAWLETLAESWRTGVIDLRDEP